MRKGELHLLIIWDRARYQQEKIINDIKNNFKIIEVYEIEWTSKYVASNFTRFYGVKLPNRSFKEKECGRGPFLLLLLWDDSPLYELRETSHGIEKVNIKMFDSKSKYRAWTRGGHKIHATNSPEETNHDITLLLGVNYDDYLKRENGEWTGNIRSIKRDITGARGWESLIQFFYTINNTLNYVVLRGDENLYANENSEEHADIDLLVENYQNAIFLMNGEQLYKFPIRPKVLVTINNRGFIFDLWDANLKYHSRAWHESMLENRVKKDFYYYLDIENDFYSRIYHCLIHKNKTAKDYYLYFENRFKGLGLEKKYDLSSYKNPMDLYYLLLLNYMKAHQYEFLKEEKDWHCFYNERVVNIEKAQCFIEKQCNIMDIVPYMVDYNSDSGYTYFKGLFNGKCVFVKYGGIGDSCQNEFHMTSKAYNASPDHFLPVRFHYFDETHKFIIYDYLECKSIEDYLLNTSIKERESVGKQIEEIYYTLYDINIVHRDIRPDNFVVTKDGKVILLDLQFAIDIENGNELNCLKNNKKIALRLGDIYRFEKYAWNDTYSFKETCNKIGVDLKFTKGEKNRIVKMPFFQIIKFKFENLKEIIWGGAKIIKYYNKKIWIKSYCEFYKKSAKGSR